MSEELKRISFDEFSDNLVHIFARIVREGKPVVVETGGGELVEVKPVGRPKPPKRTKTDEDYEAFLASAGGWADVDVDTFLKDNNESRKSSRPPVDL